MEEGTQYAYTLAKHLGPDVFKFQFGGLGSIEVYTVSEPSLQKGRRLKMEFPGVCVSHMAGMKGFMYTVFIVPTFGWGPLK